MDTITVTILDPNVEAELHKMESQKRIKIEKPDKRRKKPLQFGSMKGLVIHMADDFNAPLEDFKDYM